ncbi:hypothetical protein HDU98_006852, partial [Podochytrium sp. JEL0797]
KPITMESITILTDPFEKALNVLHGTDPDALQKIREAEVRTLKKAANDRIFEPKTTGAVGKYMAQRGGEAVAVPVGGKREAGVAEYEDAERPKKKKGGGGGGSQFDFSSW